MKIAHVITRLIVGGAQENTLASVLGLRQKYGLDVSLIAGPTSGPEGSLTDEIKNEIGEDYHEIPELIRSIHPLKDYRAYKLLKSHFKQHKPDIVHTHSAKAGFLGRMAAFDAKVPLVIHGIHGPSFGPFQNGLKNFLYLQAERWAGKRTDHFVSVARAMTQQYLAAGIGCQSKYTRIFSGFPLNAYDNQEKRDAIRRELGISTSDFVVGKIGRLFKLKGHGDLFKVAPRLVKMIPEIKFLLVGGGPWEAKFKNMADRHGLSDYFVFTGLVPPQDIPGLISTMDLLIHLSLREGLPRAIPQAQAAGKPVIAYDCDGAGEVCRDGRSGYLIPPGDRLSLCELISQIYNNPDLAFKFGSQGRDYVMENFSVEKLVDEQYRLYNNLVANLSPNYDI